MSAATKKKHVWQEVEGDVVLPTPEQSIVKVVGGRGNNLHEVEDAAGDVYIVSMPTKFRKTVWVKRGGYVLVTPIAEGDKVRAEIAAVLYPASIAAIAAAGAWPATFATAVPTTSTSAQKTGEHAAYGLDSELLPPSDPSSSDSEDGNIADESSDAVDSNGAVSRQHRVYNPNHHRGVFAKKAEQARAMLRASLGAGRFARGLHTQTASFIDYANEHKKMGEKSGSPNGEYKCGPTLYSADLWTYYQVEKSLAGQRLPQPTAGVDDTPRETNPPPPPKQS